MCFNDFTKPRSVNSILQIQKPDEPTALIRLYLWQFEYLILAAQSMYFWRISECIMLLSKIAGKPILTGFCANWAPQKSAQSLVFMRFFDICPIIPYSSTLLTIPVAVPCVRLGVNACVAHRPQPLAQVAPPATGGAPIAPQLLS